MKTQVNPKWWAEEYDTAWERVKAAFERDWEQTKHDFGADEPDLNQDVDDTVSQAMGREHIPPSGVPNFEEEEEAHRFGFGARRKFGEPYDKWKEDVEDQLREDWDYMHPSDPDSWGRNRRAIQYGYRYDR